MDQTQPEQTNFREQRRQGLRAIVSAGLVALTAWLGLRYLLPPLPAMETMTARMVLAVKCWCLAVLFCLVLGIEAVAHERLVSPAFDPLSGFETRRLQVNQRYLQTRVCGHRTHAAGGDVAKAAEFLGFCRDYH